MKVFIDSDNSGFDLKQLLVHFVGTNSHEVEDLSSKRHSPDDDFPQFTVRAAHSMQTSDDSNAQAIVVCNNAQGAAIAANRLSGVRATVCWNEDTAVQARAELDANVLCLPAQELSASAAKDVVHAWLKTSFIKAARHQRAIKDLDLA
jgi:ribose 5-phosphate isomerase B